MGITTSLRQCIQFARLQCLIKHYTNIMLCELWRLSTFCWVQFAAVFISITSFMGLRMKTSNKTLRVKVWIRLPLTLSCSFALIWNAWVLSQLIFPRFFLAWIVWKSSTGKRTARVHNIDITNTRSSSDETESIRAGYHSIVTSLKAPENCILRVVNVSIFFWRKWSIRWSIVVIVRQH